MIGRWIENHFKQKNIERAKRILPRFTMDQLIEYGKKSDELKDGWSEELLKELCLRIENDPTK